MDLKLSIDSGSQILPGIVLPQQRRATATTPSQGDGDWLCAWCLTSVAHEKDRFRIEGRDEFTFSNPSGVHFEIITFLQTLGCRESGIPTLEHTWFPGYAWSHCLCANCGQHLGWFYSGTHRFVGLIKTQIVRALTVRN